MSNSLLLFAAFLSLLSLCSPNCDYRCDGCSGPLNTQCIACAAGKFSNESVAGTCVDACSDIGTNYYADNTVCRLCNAYCATCSGPLEYNCEQCHASAIEYVTSPLKDPVHCTSLCHPPKLYDALQKTCSDNCSTNCETCTGSTPAECTHCSSGFFAQPTSNECLSGCSSGYFADSASRKCEACDPLCSACTDSTSDSCSECVASAQLSGTSCSCPTGLFLDGSSCAPCNFLCSACTGASNSACSACSDGNYSVEGTTTCVAAC